MNRKPCECKQPSDKETKVKIERILVSELVDPIRHQTSAGQAKNKEEAKITKTSAAVLLVLVPMLCVRSHKP
jgi:hypothetical protein